MSAVGRVPLLVDQQADAELDRRALRVVAVADDDHVARPDLARQPVDVHRHAPDLARDLAVGARDQLALEHAHDRVDAASARRARTARATRGCSGGRARARSSRPPARRRRRRSAPGRDPRAPSACRPRAPGSPSPACGKCSRITSDTRSITCGRKSGSRASARSSTQRVCVLMLAEAHRHVLVARIDAAHQLGVADGGGDRVGVRVAMTRDVDARWSGDDAEEYSSWRPGRPWPGRGEKVTPIRRGVLQGRLFRSSARTYARAREPVQSRCPT